MIFDKVDRLAGVEQMRRDGVAHEMNVTVGRRKIGEHGVAAEKGLDLTYPETALAADKERRIVIAARGEIVTKQRNEASEQRLLPRDAVLRTENSNFQLFEVEVGTVKPASLRNAQPVEVDQAERPCRGRSDHFQQLTDLLLTKVRRETLSDHVHLVSDEEPREGWKEART